VQDSSREAAVGSDLRSVLSSSRGSTHWHPSSSSGKRRHAAPTVALIAIVLLISWMGLANGGYFLGEWAPLVLSLATLMFAVSLAGLPPIPRSKVSIVVTGFFALYAVWTFLSLLWSPDRGAAWLGAAQTLFYLLVFWISVGLISRGASRRWVLLASVLGPAAVAMFTMFLLLPHLGELFDRNRLLGSVGYYNGEAAFLLVPFWAAIYLAGSRRVSPIIRGLILAGLVPGSALVILTQSRGAMVAVVVSSFVYFLLSCQRLRGLLALAPIAVAVSLSFPGLNSVYLELLHGGDPASVLNRVLPLVWLTTAGAGLYGLFWGLVDERWKLSAGAARAAGVIVLAGGLVVLSLGAYIAYERAGEDPLTWSGEKWRAFAANDKAGQEQSRYLSVSGMGRYTLWQVAWEDFISHPVLGIGTQNYEETYYQLRKELAGTVRQPHSLPLEILAERGAVGGVLFLGFLTTCLATGLRRGFRRLDAEDRALTGALAASVFYWLVHSSFDWFWQIPAVTLTAILYLAMLAAPWNAGENTPSEAAPANWSLRLCGATLATVVIVAVAPLYIADLYLARSTAAEDPRTALSLIARAETFNPVDPYLPQHEAELAAHIKDWRRATQAYKRSIELNSRSYVPYELMASYYERRGDTEEALSLYREASSLNPLASNLRREVMRMERQPRK
jgi:tetratricopeptide (TPR) repeat protein